MLRVAGAQQSVFRNSGIRNPVPGAASTEIPARNEQKSPCCIIPRDPQSLRDDADRLFLHSVGMTESTYDDRMDSATAIQGACDLGQEGRQVARPDALPLLAECIDDQEGFDNQRPGLPGFQAPTNLRAQEGGSSCCSACPHGSASPNRCPMSSTVGFPAAIRCCAMSQSRWFSKWLRW